MRIALVVVAWLFAGQAYAAASAAVADVCFTASDDTTPCNLDLGTEGVGWNAGDVAVVHTCRHSAQAISFSITADEAYTALFAERTHTGNANFRHRAYYRVLGAGNDNVIQANVGGDNPVGAVVSIISGTTGTPVGAVDAETASGTVVTAPSATVNTGDFVFRGFCSSDENTLTGPTTELYGGASYQTAVANDWAFAGSYETAGGTSSGTANATMGASTPDVGLAFTVGWTPSASAAVTFDAETYNPGDTVTVTASPAFSSAMSTLTLTGGQVINAESGASTSSADFILSELTEYVDTGDAEATELGVSLTGTVSDGTDTADDTLTINPTQLDGPTYYLKTSTCTVGSDCPEAPPSGDGLWPTGTSTGDTVLVQKTGGAGSIDTVSTDGVITLTTPPVDVAIRAFQSGAWTADDNRTLTSGDTTPPVVSNVEGEFYALEITFRATTDENTGTMYWAISSNSSRTCAQIKAATGTALDGTIAPPILGVNEVTPISLGATVDGTYYPHACQDDADSNESLPAVGSAFTIDTAAPQATDVSVTDSGVVVDFDEDVDGCFVGDCGFTLNMSGGAVTLSSPEYTDTDQITFTPSRVIVVGETGTMDYTIGDVLDLYGNELQNFTGETVSNGSLAGRCAVVRAVTFDVVRDTMNSVYCRE